MADSGTSQKVANGRARTERRAFLKTVFAGTLASLGTGPVSASSDDKTTIIEAQVSKSDEASNDYEPVERHVPTDWYDAVTHATDVHDREEFYERPDVVGTLVKPSTFDKAEPSIKVEVAKETGPTPDSAPDPSDSNDEIPDEVDGVPIDKEPVAEDPVQRPTPSIQATCGSGDFGTSPPSGVVCSGDSPGTLATPLVKDGTMYFATNWHLFDPNPVGSSAELSQGDGDPIGEVVDGDSTDDFVACEPINGHTPTRDINGTPYQSWGHYTKSGIQALAADNKSVTKQGAGSCGTSGQIRGVGTKVEADGETRYDQVRWGSGTSIRGGDSGSVAYRHQTDDKVLIVALNAGARNPFFGSVSFSYGTGAYHIYEEYGYGW